MTAKIDPIIVTVEFKGRTYLAQITPTINGKEVTATPSMQAAEATQKIYSKQLKDMLEKQESVYTDAHGLLTRATKEGFACASGLIEHADKTNDLWTRFVESLH